MTFQGPAALLIALLLVGCGDAGNDPPANTQPADVPPSNVPRTNEPRPSEPRDDVPSASQPPSATAPSASVPPSSRPPAPPGEKPAPSQEGKGKSIRLAPVDEASKDRSFAEFRETLLAAVRKKDADALLALVDPSIRTTFGNGGGREDFAGRWKIRERDSKIWQELEWVLTHGGGFRGDGANRMFWAPYVYSAWPDSADPYLSIAVVGSDVPMRARPDPAAGVTATLSYEIVESLSDPRSGWRRVEQPGGKRGWVETRGLRSHLDYRAGFHKRGGRWSMAAFVAGD